MKKYIFQISLPILFASFSFPLFCKINETSKSIIDEEFHLRQGLHFCNKRFDVWDSKITTFPGLYIASCILIPFDLCSVFGLRLISFLASVANISIIYQIRKQSLSGSTITIALEALSVSILPPLYFFIHLYYTDVISLTAVLLLIYFHEKKKHLAASAFGAASVLMRQTNIVWVSMYFGISALDELIKNFAYSRHVKPSDVSLLDIKILRDILSSYTVIRESVCNILSTNYGYIAVIFMFLGYITFNGSIVVGDKKAHQATLHITQILYFSLFSVAFGVSTLLNKSITTIKKLKKKWIVFVMLLVTCVVIVKYNTLVHPYLLSDNRHYIFYVWNRLYGKYSWFKYVITPVYVFALAFIQTAIGHKSTGFKLMYWISVFLVLCFQKLLEMRYFLVPFVIFRLNTRLPKSITPLLIEIFYYLVVNVITFYIFFHKEIKWQDFADVQRIIW